MGMVWFSNILFKNTLKHLTSFPPTSENFHLPIVLQAGNQAIITFISKLFQLKILVAGKYKEQDTSAFEVM
jgi:hypothetical protein